LKIKELHKSESEKTRTFILSISSFSALVNLASICTHVKFLGAKETHVDHRCAPLLFLWQLLARAFHVHTDTRIRPEEA
jgi:hypothetical protein